MRASICANAGVDSRAAAAQSASDADELREIHVVLQGNRTGSRYSTRFGCASFTVVSHEPTAIARRCEASKRRRMDWVGICGARLRVAGMMRPIP